MSLVYLTIFSLKRDLFDIRSIFEFFLFIILMNDKLFR